MSTLWAFQTDSLPLLPIEQAEAEFIAARKAFYRRRHKTQAALEKAMSKVDHALTELNRSRKAAGIAPLDYNWSLPAGER